LETVEERQDPEEHIAERGLINNVKFYVSGGVCGTLGYMKTGCVDIEIYEEMDGNEKKKTCIQ